MGIRGRGAGLVAACVPKRLLEAMARRGTIDVERGAYSAVSDLTTEIFTR